MSSNILPPPPIPKKEEEEETEGEEKKEEIYILQKFGEFRVDVDIDEKIVVSLESGTAEIFGTELSSHTKYGFSNTSISIFTYHGAKIKIEGGPYHEYLPNLPSQLSSHPMIKYLEIHDGLEKIRNQNTSGPIVMVLGDKDSGKTSLCKILFSYATRRKRKVAYVDLNCDCGIISIPTSISCIASDEPYCVKNGFSLNSSPLTFCYGSFSTDSNIELYMKNNKVLSESIHQKMNNFDRKLKNGGMIIDTPPFTSTKQTELFSKLIIDYKVNHIFFLGNEGRLYYDLKKKLQKYQNIVMKCIPKSGGVVPKNDTKRKRLHSELVHNYFYLKNSELSPSPYVYHFDKINVLKVGGDWFAPESALPIGMKSVQDRCKVNDVMISPELKNSILAVSCEEKDKDGILKENIFGFMLVRKVDMKNRELHVLQPNPNDITQFNKKFLIMTDVKWIDQ